MIIAGKYEVLGKLGQGGQGSVYKVRHLGLDEVRALKVQPDHGTGEETVARFRREGRALARLRHAHIVQVFDLGRDADQYYLEMEYVDGPNLAQYLKANGRPPLLDALEIARHVADALTYAHAQPYVDSAGVQHTGMVHRDIKPSNILLRDQATMYALLADFGLVKLGDPGERTTTGTMLGTYKYSAPEQLGLKRGRARVPVDFRADVFAFGLVLYELLEGRQFHAGLEPQEILARVLFEPDALEPEFTVSVLPGLRALLRRMVQRDPENRPPTMKVVLAGLDEAISDLRGGDATTVVVTPRGRAGGGEPRTEEELEEQIRTLMAERERRRAQAARGDAQAARARALDAGAVELATPEFETAVRREEEASFALSAGDLTHARELYELTSQLFAEAEARAAAARERRAAEEAREAAQAAREGARSAGAPALAAGLWSGAEEREHAAAALLASGDMEAARRGFDGVATAFRAARSAAETERERRRGEANVAAATVTKAREEAEAAGAADHAAAAWALACAAAAEGERQAAAGDDLDAAASFRRAGVEFADATRASLDARARAAAAGARRAAETAESAGARELAADEYAAARGQLAAASAALDGGDVGAARELFADATRALDGVAALASRRRQEEEARRVEAERQRRDAEEARRRAGEEERRSAAEGARQLAAAEVAQAAAAAAAERARAVGADTLAATQLSAAEERHAEARDALARDALTEAAERFAHAAAGFEEAERTAVHEAARRRALAARDGAASARGAARDAEAARWAPELASDAERLWQAGEDAVAREAFADAERCFAGAAGQFEHATAVARERADEVRRQEEEQRRRREEEEARRRAAEEARRREEEEARRRAAEERARQLAAVEVGRASATAAAARAREAGADDLAPAVLDAATMRLEDAEAAVGREALYEAAELFAAAGAAFGEATHAAMVEAARRRALGIRAAAAEARGDADDAEAARWAHDAWRSAEGDWTAAEAALARNAFDDAVAGFGAATSGFETAVTMARAAAEAERRRREEEEEARRQDEEERARQLAAVDAARAAASAARARARDAGADTLAPAALAVATARVAEAETAARREAFSEAVQLFTTARAAFDDASRAATVEAARRRAVAARERAAEARASAGVAESERWAAGAWRTAEATWTAAEAALGGHAFDDAATGFGAAATEFEVAATAARGAAEAEHRRQEEAERRRREDEAARRRAEEEAKRRAAAEEAKRAAAEEAKRRADADARRRAQEESRRRAEEEARQAQAARRRAQEEAERLAAEERTRLLAAVEEARATTARAAARARDAGAAELAAESLAVATARLAEAEAAARGEALGDATALFAAAGAAFDAAAEAAAAEAQRRHREEQKRARRAAEEEQRRAEAEARRRVQEEAVRRREEERRLAEAETRRRVDEDARPAADDAEATVVVPPRPDEVPEAPTIVAPPSVEQPARAWWPYATAAALAVALGLGYALLRSGPEEIATRPPDTRAQRTPETTPETAPPATLPPGLAWGTMSPPIGETATVKEGERLLFQASLAQADAQPGLELRWLLDGKEVSRGASWEYAPEFTDGGRTRTVQVVATSEGRRLEQGWPVTVVNVDRPPVIASASPAEGPVTVEGGVPQTFALKASDPDEGDRLTYTWERNGKRVASGAQPELTVRDAADGDEIRVTVTDEDGAGAGSRSWKVALKSPPPAEPQPPRIVGQTPTPKGRLAVEEGRAIDFSLKVTDPDPKEKFAYEWFVDGRPVGTGKTLRFEAPALEERKVARRVEAEVTDAAGLKSGRVGWDVDVVWTPPEVVRLEPKDRKLTLEPGETRELRASSTSPAKGALTYEWRLDGKLQQPTTSARFQLPSDLSTGSHAVEVASIDPRGLRSDPLGWTVDVRAAPPPTVPITPPPTMPTTPTTIVSMLPPSTVPSRPPPPTLPPTGTGAITQAEARDWLARYQNAWERKDAGALVALGITSGDRAQEIVSKLDYLRQVRVGNESVSDDGTTVSFDRTDVADTGKELRHPRKTCQLQKVGGRVVARGGCL
jgi:hypothetical protein